MTCFPVQTSDLGLNFTYVPMAPASHVQYFLMHSIQADFIIMRKSILLCSDLLAPGLRISSRNICITTLDGESCFSASREWQKFVFHIHGGLTSVTTWSPSVNMIHNHICSRTLVCMHIIFVYRSPDVFFQADNLFVGPIFDCSLF